jgi:hypothetical protein
MSNDLSHELEKILQSNCVLFYSRVLFPLARKGGIILKNVQTVSQATIYKNTHTRTKERKFHALSEIRTGELKNKTTAELGFRPLDHLDEDFKLLAFYWKFHTLGVNIPTYSRAYSCVVGLYSNVSRHCKLSSFAETNSISIS